MSTGHATMTFQQEMQYLGDTLRALRKSKGMTLTVLAEKTGTHVGTLSKIERNQTQPSLDMLYRIVDALGMTFADLFNQTVLQHPDDAGSETQTRLREQQTALNATFIAMLDDERELLLEFARLLSARHRTGDSADAAKTASDADITQA